MAIDIDDVLEILKVVKACDDAELHIDTGDLKLSIVRGDVPDSGRSFIGQSPETPQAVAPAAPSAPAAEVTAQAQASPPTAAPTPAAAASPSAPAAPAAEEVDDADLVPISANVTSVFYRKPSPDEPAFVEVGDEVTEDSVVCLLEVMKCFRQVTADVAGRIEKICVESNEMVEEGTVMFLIRPN